MQLSQLICNEKLVINQGNVLLDGKKKLMPIYEDVFENAQDMEESDDIDCKSNSSKGNEYAQRPMVNKSILNSITNSFTRFEQASDVEHSSTRNQTSAIQSQS